MKLLILVVALVVAATAQLAEHQHWGAFKEIHSKNYKLVEDQLRFQIFKKNLKKIEEHNEKYEKGEKSYFLKITKFADWTEEEYISMLNRQAANKPQENQFLGVFKSNLNENPAEIDWRNQAVVSRVKDQGLCGSCWAFSVTGAVESQLAIVNKQNVSLSEQELVDCSGEQGNLGCGGGDQYPTFSYIKKHGLASEEDYPYNGYDNKCARSSAERTVKSISGAKRVNPDEESLISAIASVGPISVSVDASIWSLYGGGILDDDDCGDFLNHAVLAVGYTKDSLIIKNSWGEDWGEDGYIRLARGLDICGINDDNSYPVL